VIEVWSKFCFVGPVKFVKSHLHTPLAPSPRYAHKVYTDTSICLIFMLNLTHAAFSKTYIMYYRYRLHRWCYQRICSAT